MAHKLAPLPKTSVIKFASRSALSFKIKHGRWRSEKYKVDGVHPFFFSLNILYLAAFLLESERLIV